MTDKERVNILVVDDQPAKMMTYATILESLDETLITAQTAREALDKLLRHDFALVVLDVELPDLDGFQLAAMLREHPRFEKTPIIFVSAVHLTNFDRLRGYESGAVDYVPVPIVPEILRAKVKVFVDLHRATRDLRHANERLEERVQQRTSELQASNRKLQESEERLRLAGDAAQFGTYDVDAGQGHIYCSPQLQHLLGMRPEEHLRMDLDSFTSLVHESERDVVRKCLTGEQLQHDDRHHQEFRVIRPDETVVWLLDRGRAFFENDESGPRLTRVMGTVLDITERKQGEERQLLLMAELDHRVKNILANVSAIARLSSRRAESVEEFVRALDARIQAIARAHSLLRRDNWTGISLKKYLSELLNPFFASAKTNITFEGEAIFLRPEAAQSLVLVFHELATNAAKYGALSSPEGRVTVTWERNREKGPNWIDLKWVECDGPPVNTDATNGFGVTVIRAASRELGMEIDHRFLSSGVCASLSGPLEQAAQAPKPFHPPNEGWSRPIRNTASERVQCRILVVEDEALVGMQVKSDLENAGHTVIGPAQTLQQGMGLVESESLDFVLLDVQLGDELSIPIAEMLMTRKVPFAFTTGFEDQNILPKHLRSVRCLNKPYAIGEVSRFLLDVWSDQSRAVS
jgi:PAS domain S-box-containing protein